MDKDNLTGFLGYVKHHLMVKTKFLKRWSPAVFRLKEELEKKCAEQLSENFASTSPCALTKEDIKQVASDLPFGSGEEATERLALLEKVCHEYLHTGPFF